MKEAEDLLDHAREIVKKTVADCMSGRGSNWSTIKSKVKERAFLVPV
ncbi:MAG: hypothetical protein V8Q43_02600 [Christensenellaceae bacterium]